MLRRVLVNSLAGLGLVAIVLAAYLMLARPYQLHWGATQEEISRSMPGDELDTYPTFLATRAITIKGTPRELWPWLVQMGYDRAGYYGYDIIENIGSKSGPDTAKRIEPELQNVKVGDKVPISPLGSWVFYAIVPERYFIWSDEKSDSGFTWALYPIDAHHTRLVSRIRWSHNWSQPSQIAPDIFTEFRDHLAVRKILQGVRGRVEGPVEPTAWTNIEVAIYLAAALTLAVAVILNVAAHFPGQGGWQGWPRVPRLADDLVCADTDMDGARTTCLRHIWALANAIHSQGAAAPVRPPPVDAVHVDPSHLTQSAAAFVRRTMRERLSTVGQRARLRRSVHPLA